MCATLETAPNCDDETCAETESNSQAKRVMWEQRPGKDDHDRHADPRELGQCYREIVVM